MGRVGRCALLIAGWTTLACAARPAPDPGQTSEDGIGDGTEGDAGDLSETSDAGTSDTSDAGDGDDAGDDSGDDAGDDSGDDGGPFICDFPSGPLQCQSYAIGGLYALLGDRQVPPEPGCPGGFPSAFSGRLVGPHPMAPDTWVLDTCACGEVCDEPYLFDFTLETPPGWEATLPACLEVHTPSGEGCEASRLSISDLEDPDAPPVYLAGRGPGAPPGSEDWLMVERVPGPDCHCDGCCPELGGTWNFRFTVGEQVLELSETQVGELEVQGWTYEVVNAQSTVLYEFCDEIEFAFAWVMVRSDQGG